MTTPRKHKVQVKRDPDFVAAEKALRRAAKKAREIASRSSGYVVVYRDGRIVKERMSDQASESGTRRKKTV